MSSGLMSHDISQVDVLLQEGVISLTAAGKVCCVVETKGCRVEDLNEHRDYCRVIDMNKDKDYCIDMNKARDYCRVKDVNKARDYCRGMDVNKDRDYSTVEL